MQNANTENREGSLKMNTIIKDGKKYQVTEMGSHTVVCSAKGFCSIPGYKKKRLVANGDGTYNEKITKFHKMAGGYTQYDLVENS